MHQKKHQNLIENLKKGDKIITRGGIFGTIVNFQGGSTTNITENKNVQYSATDVNATIYAHLQGMIP